MPHSQLHQACTQTNTPPALATGSEEAMPRNVTCFPTSPFFVARVAANFKRVHSAQHIIAHIIQSRIRTQTFLSHGKWPQLTGLPNKALTAKVKMCQPNQLTLGLGWDMRPLLGTPIERSCAAPSPGLPRQQDVSAHDVLGAFACFARSVMMQLAM